MDVLTGIFDELYSVVVYPVSIPAKLRRTCFVWVWDYIKKVLVSNGIWTGIQN